MSHEHVIVVGVDHAWRRSGALDWALHEAVLRRIPLRAVHVVDDRLRHAYDEPLGLDGSTVTTVAVPEPEGRLADELEQYVTAADPALDLGTDILVGVPERRLAELSSGADLTVVGRRGLGGFSRLLLGSTSEYVAVHGAGPVVVVPDGWQAVGHEQSPIVVGVDAREQSEAALEFAFETAVAHGVPLWMMHSWDVPAPHAWDTPAVTGVHDRWKAAAERRLADLADQWGRKYPEADLRLKLRQCHPVLGLLDTAQSVRAQLIVVGGRRHHRFTGLLGSVTRGVLQHAGTPVAVVHERRPAI